MKIKFFFLVFLTPLILLSQEEILSMNDVESKQEVSMNDAIGKSEDGIYRYYAKGETEPFTGILYANYSTLRLLLGNNILRVLEKENGLITMTMVILEK